MIKVLRVWLAGLILLSCVYCMKVCLMLVDKLDKKMLDEFADKMLTQLLDNADILKHNSLQ